MFQDERNQKGMTIAQDSLEKVRRTVLDALEGQVAKVVLFGSRGAGTAHRRSDIDVGLLPGEGFDDCVVELREQLEELNIPYSVDLVDLREVSPEFRRRVFEEGVVWRS